MDYADLTPKSYYKPWPNAPRMGRHALGRMLLNTLLMLGRYRFMQQFNRSMNLCDCKVRVEGSSQRHTQGGEIN